MYQLESFSDQNEQINFAPAIYRLSKNQYSLTVHQVGPNFFLSISIYFMSFLTGFYMLIQEWFCFRS